ncbi:hypothetical protein, partial [Pantoea sp. Morm]|uniref:hypothetical protein n=1 Tax=Pantoea sp. Morm TaxID=2601250 RepID=UPI0031FD6A95
MPRVEARRDAGFADPGVFRFPSGSPHAFSNNTFFASEHGDNSGLKRLTLELIVAALRAARQAFRGVNRPG